MERGTVIKVAEGNFPFHFYIQKAIAGAEDGKMIVEGVASTPNVDHDKERMSVEALKSMANVINTSGVPLRVEHSQADNAIIGTVNKAWIDERNQLWIKAVLDEAHPAAGILYKGLKEGVKMGLSVGGYVRRAVQEMVEGIGKQVNTFYDVALDEVSVTQKPSNYDARLMAKSFAKSEGEVDVLAAALESNEFLFSSAMGQSDYLREFAKSIPEEEWKDVSKDYKLEGNNKSMADETETKKTTKAEDESEKKTKAADDTETKTEKAKEDESEMTKSVTRGEFNALVKAVGELGNTFTEVLGKMAKAMDSAPMDQNNPDEKKKDPEEGKNVDKSSGGEAVDGEQPKEAKKDPEEGKNVDKAANGDDENGTRETKAKEDTYDMETVERAIKRIKAVGKSMDGDEEKTTKAADETETRKSIKKVADIDALAIAVADTIERVEKTMKEGGYQTEHIAKAMINELRGDSQFRKDLGHFLSEAGPKRSVINGTPFVKMKDGRMFALTLASTEGERTEKSEKDVVPGTNAFKAQWGARFSSQKESE